MAFETGPANGVDDLLDKLKIFADALGYEILRWRDSSDYNGKELSLKHSKAGVFNFYTDNGNGDEGNPGPWLACYGSTSFDSDINTMERNSSNNLAPAQPGHSPLNATNGLIGPFTRYYFFGTQQYLHIVIEISPGVYAHSSVGTLDKAFDYVGGEYVVCTSWYHGKYNNRIGSSGDNYHGYPWDNKAYYASYYDRIRCDLPDLNHPYWLTFYDREEDGYCWGGMPRNGERGPIHGVFHHSPSTFNGLAPLFPIMNIARVTGGRRYILGTPADVRIVNITHLVPGQSMHIGNDEWLIFPVKSKNGPKGQPNSGIYGLAYRKIV
ncbi:hypothetical protein [Spartinivicinus ruber]|uniref:hypothetical protein n=1 Tax=Spartinivicinus ruber TaxID=2683272 RepID=UPI0013D07B87|nr:hypothetical protein [Spartinivicinus ruber]